MTQPTASLSEKHCIPCEGDVKPLSSADAANLSGQLASRWKLTDGSKRIEAEFEFKNYFRALAFVNAAAYIAINEDHHPDIAFGYKNAHITYWTHAAGGLTENDFICAAKIDKLVT